MTFVLCYDTANLDHNATNNDAIDVREFLEKYINIKFSLFNDRVALSNLVSVNSDKIIKNILTNDARLVDQIKQALLLLKDIYLSENYYKYANFLGDLRKVKRLINSMVLFDVHNTDFENVDVESRDLINLLIIYINYPNLFRTIYNAETAEGTGNFSLTHDGDQYRNATGYQELVDEKKLSDNESFFLAELFDVTTLRRNNKCDINKLNYFKRACFNGVNGTGRNLEFYLNLIVNLKKPAKTNSNTFYVKLKDRFINGLDIYTILESEDFKKEDAEYAKSYFLNTVGNSAIELPPTQAINLINYIIDNIHSFSIIEENSLSASQRSAAVYILLKVLDLAAWKDSLNQTNNSKDNIKKISDWIFGEGDYLNKSIVYQFTEENKLPLGYFDLMLFRLYCSADRESNLYNIQNSLSNREGAHAPTEGSVKEIARFGMRQISQIVFARFQEQYISTKRNFFEDVKKLKITDLYPNPAVVDKYTMEDVESAKNSILGFIVYQLTNKLIQSGVGCGYYDPEGDAFNNKISLLMNRYLFDVCFTPSNLYSDIDGSTPIKIDTTNYGYFLDYLLSHLGRALTPLPSPPVASVAEFQKTLNIKLLKKFWLKNKTHILEAKFHEQEKVVKASNYKAYYNIELVKLYSFLDKLDELSLS